MAACRHRVGAAVKITANNFAHDLVARNYSRHAWRKFAFDNMKIGAAHAACQHL
jgi:hypothetical protein